MYVIAFSVFSVFLLLNVVLKKITATKTLFINKHYRFNKTKVISQISFILKRYEEVQKAPLFAVHEKK
jgi:ascorbate-specific PTS system EIIC-type component UlaA